MNTFSVNSLKLLDKSLEEFEKKYIHHLDFFTKNESAKQGEKLHGLIYYYLCNFDTKKIEASLLPEEKILFEEIKQLDIFKYKNNFIKKEENFLIKVKKEHTIFYLAGRFDAVYRENENYIIYDWKLKNIPKDPKNDLQSIVYLYCASKIFNTQNISMCYFSLKTKENAVIKFEDENNYVNKIYSIIKKLPKKYLA